MTSSIEKSLHHRLNDPLHDKFMTKWLTSINSTKSNKHVIAIINGWMSEFHKNQWYADALHDNFSIFAYDSRGQGQSPKQGEFNAIQGAIDANRIIGKAFQEYKLIASPAGIEGNKILQGNCVGTMALSALFAGRLPLTKQIDGTILISPVSNFSLPLPLKFTYFLPEWFVRFSVNYLAPTFAKLAVPGKDSEDSRKEALSRARKMDPRVAVKQTRQIFWKENVTDYWKYIDVPSLILVSRSDPLVKLEHSFDAFDKLPYPIWLELEAPDHLLLEGNIEYLKNLLPEFANDPWQFYENNKHLTPY